MAKKINYHRMMEETFNDIVYSKCNDHEWCAHNTGKGLKKPFTQSGFGWAMSCMMLRNKHKELEHGSL